MATPAEDLTEKSFYFPEFIHACAPLDVNSALEYFKYSPWYAAEPLSTNAQWRMQNTGIEVGERNEMEELKMFRGIEFAVVHDRGPSLFIIHKRERLSPTEVLPLEAYYIINNRIQQSPDLYSLIANRVNASLNYLVSSLHTLRSHKPDYTPRKSHSWPIHYDPSSAFSSGAATAAAPSTDMDTDEPSSSAKSAKATNTGQRQIVTPLLNAINTTAQYANSRSPNTLPNTKIISLMTHANRLRAADSIPEVNGHGTNGRAGSVIEGAPTPPTPMPDAPAVAVVRRKKKKTGSLAVHPQAMPAP